VLQSTARQGDAGVQGTSPGLSELRWADELEPDADTDSICFPAASGSRGDGDQDAAGAERGALTSTADL
jgi:hypothetical protein